MANLCAKVEVASFNRSRDIKEVSKFKTKSIGFDKGSRDLLLKFLDPSISQKRLKLETSNLACRLATEEPKRKKNAKLGQKGS